MQIIKAYATMSIITHRGAVEVVLVLEVRYNHAHLIAFQIKAYATMSIITHRVKPRSFSTLRRMRRRRTTSTSTSTFRTRTTSTASPHTLETLEAAADAAEEE